MHVRACSRDRRARREPAARQPAGQLDGRSVVGAGTLLSLALTALTALLCAVKSSPSHIYSALLLKLSLVDQLATGCETAACQPEAFRHCGANGRFNYCFKVSPQQPGLTTLNTGIPRSRGMLAKGVHGAYFKNASDLDSTLLFNFYILKQSDSYRLFF